MGTNEVAGEPAEALWAALCHIEHVEILDASPRFDFALPPDLAAPLVRAILRIEAELLLEEADAFGRAERTTPRDGGRSGERRPLDERNAAAVRILIDRLVLAEPASGARVE